MFGIAALGTMGAHVPTVVVVVVPVGPVVVVVVATVVVVAATVVVVVLPIGIGIVGIGIVGIGNWAICTRVSATGCARPGLLLRSAKLVSVAARRRMRAKRRRRSDLMMRTPSRWPFRHERDREGTLDTASGQPWCLGRRPSYSGQPATGVQVQVRAVTTTAGLLGVMATNPMSRIGEFGPENTSLTAPVTGPTVPS